MDKIATICPLCSTPLIIFGDSKPYCPNAECPYSLNRVTPNKLVEKIANDRLLTQKEILEAPRPTVAHLVNHHKGIGELVSVDMDGILKAQDAKTAKAILSDPNIIEIDPDDVLIGTLKSLYDRLDAEKDLAELKAIGYVLDMFKAGWVLPKKRGK